MVTRKMAIYPGQKVPEEVKNEIRAAAKRPIVFDDDAPELTDEQLAKFTRKKDRTL